MSGIRNGSIKKILITIRLDSGDIKMLDEKSFNCRMSRSEFIRRLIRDFEIDVATRTTNVKVSEIQVQTKSS